MPDHVRVVGNGSRAAIISDRRITGLSAEVIAELVAEVGPLWRERHQARLEFRPRKRAVGAGAEHRLVFIDRLLATGLGSQTGGRVVTPPHRKFKKNPPEWYEEIYERRRKAHSSRRIRVEHGIAHLKNWRVLARHHGRREHMSDTIHAVVGLLSHQQTATRADRQAQ